MSPSSERCGMNSWLEEHPKYGEVRHVLRWNGYREDQCVYCQRGECLQDCQSSDAWKENLIVHNYGDVLEET